MVSKWRMSFVYMQDGGPGHNVQSLKDALRWNNVPLFKNLEILPIWFLLKKRLWLDKVGSDKLNDCNINKTHLEENSFIKALIAYWENERHISW